MEERKIIDRYVLKISREREKVRLVLDIVVIFVALFMLTQKDVLDDSRIIIAPCAIIVSSYAIGTSWKIINNEVRLDFFYLDENGIQDTEGNILVRWKDVHKIYCAYEGWDVMSYNLYFYGPKSKEIFVIPDVNEFEGGVFTVEKVIKQFWEKYR